MNPLRTPWSSTPVKMTLPTMACGASTLPLFNLKLSQSSPTRRPKPPQALNSYTQISTKSCSTCNTHFKAKFPMFSKLPLLSGRRLRFHVRTQNLPFCFVFCFYDLLGDSFCVCWAGGSTERACFWGRGRHGCLWRNVSGEFCLVFCDYAVRLYHFLFNSCVFIYLLLLFFYNNGHSVFWMNLMGI